MSLSDVFRIGVLTYDFFHLDIKLVSLNVIELFVTKPCSCLQLLPVFLQFSPFVLIFRDNVIFKLIDNKFAHRILGIQLSLLFDYRRKGGISIQSDFLIRMDNAQIIVGLVSRFSYYLFPIFIL